MSYNPLIAFNLITNGNMANTITSDPVKVSWQGWAGIQLIWTGAPVGTFDFQTCVSVDTTLPLQNAKWSSLQVLPVITAPGSADDAYIQLEPINSGWIRVVYNKTSGSGILNCWVSAK